jgi:hypothetical protein
MTAKTRAEVDAVLANLQRLVEALDRRVPRTGHAQEARIASDAAALRARALARMRLLAAPHSDS